MLEMTNLSVNGRLAPLNWHCAAPGLIALIGPNGSGKSTLLADLLSRNLLPSGELPVGILTASLGAPLLIYLLVRRHA